MAGKVVPTFGAAEAVVRLRRYVRDDEQERRLRGVPLGAAGGAGLRRRKRRLAAYDLVEMLKE